MTELNEQVGQRESGNMKNTFEVTVRFQQNATWQGLIHWIEKDRKQNFRSALEMLMLMDEAVAESAENRQRVSWKEEG